MAETRGDSKGPRAGDLLVDPTLRPTGQVLRAGVSIAGPDTLRTRPRKPPGRSWG